jgi:CubicO group peptidase (beta-lactamase class C family)
VYSDLGFILLGIVLEQVGGGSLADQFATWRAAIGLTEPLDFQPPPEWHARTAFTEHYESRGTPLQGVVHDQNTAALGGVAAHAGLFGTAAAVGAAARWWLARLRGHDDSATGVSANAARIFTRRSIVPGSSRALGWDTMLPTSSCGTRMSPSAIGHTGFTGTSLWIDPDRDAYYVLLTNRVLASNTSDEIQRVRREFHEAASTR